MIFTFYIYVGDLLLDRRWNHVEPRRRPYRWHFYRREHHKLWGSRWIPTPSLVELYGSSTQECGVARGGESSDTSSLNERLGIFGERKIFAGILRTVDLLVTRKSKRGHLSLTFFPTRSVSPSVRGNRVTFPATLPLEKDCGWFHQPISFFCNLVKIIQPSPLVKRSPS